MSDSTTSHHRTGDPDQANRGLDTTPWPELIHNEYQPCAAVLATGEQIQIRGYRWLPGSSPATAGGPITSGPHYLLRRADDSLLAVRSSEVRGIVYQDCRP